MADLRRLERHLDAKCDREECATEVVDRWMDVWLRLTDAAEEASRGGP